MVTSVGPRGARRARRAVAELALATALVAGGLVSTAGFAAAASRPATAGTWSLVQSVPPLYESLSDLSCPSAATCFAIATNDVSQGVVVGTKDGGTDWSIVYQPALTVSVDSLSCTSATACAAVLQGARSDGVTFTTDGGVHWKVSRLAGLQDAEGRIWCASSSRCVAVVDAAPPKSTPGTTFTTLDGGSTWTAKTSNLEGYVSSELACTSLTVCVAGVVDAGQVWRLVRTTDGGGSWTSLTLPHELVNPIDVACTSSRRCIVAANGYVYASSNAGAGWSEQHRGQDWLSPVSASCDGAGHCVVTLGGRPGHVLLGLSANGGVSWTLHSFGNDVVGLGSACASATSCVAAYGATPTSFDEPVPVAVDATADGGTTWQRRFESAGVYQLLAVDCPTATACIATGASTGGGFVETSSNGGASWAARRLLPAYLSLNAVSCVTASTCLATSGTPEGFGSLVITHNAGASWARVALPSGATPYTVTCTSSTRCFSTSGPDLFVSNDAGATWTTATLPKAPAGQFPPVAFSLACPSANVCVGTASDTTGIQFVTSTDGGKVWTSGQKLTGTDWQSAQTECTSAQDCVTIATNFDDLDGGFYPEVYATTNGGTSWTNPASPASSGLLAGLACTSDHVCEAAVSQTSGSSTLYTSSDNAQSWTSSTTPLLEANGLACSAADACLVVGESTSGGAAIARLT